MSARDDIDGESAEARAQRLHGEYRSDPIGYVRKMMRRVDTSDRDVQRVKLLQQRADLERLYTESVEFHNFVDQRAAEIDAHPATIIIDLIRSGFAPLVLALGEAASQAIQAAQAHMATAPQRPDWMREMILNIKGDMEGQ
jgi:hypothetical protein